LAVRKLRAVYQQVSLSPANADLSIVYCTCIKDRFEHLQKTLPANLSMCKGDEKSRFVILNYDCPDPRTDAFISEHFQDEMKTGKLVYLKLMEKEFFEFSHARNVSFRAAEGDIVCNVDADNFIGKGFSTFLRRALATPKTFVFGPKDGRGLRGRIAVRKEEWLTLGGYDEGISGRLGEDGNLIERLHRSRFKGIEIVEESYCKTISHSDDSRFKYSTVSKSAYLEKLRERKKQILLAPNKDGFGKGRVLKNFTEWIELN
jgi:hypothetical protein